MLHLETTGFGSKLVNGGGDGVINENFRFIELIHDRSHALEVAIIKFSFLELPAINAEHGGKQAVHELLLAHFEREDADSLPEADRSVLGDIEEERCFA